MKINFHRFLLLFIFFTWSTTLPGQIKLVPLQKQAKKESLQTQSRFSEISAAEDSALHLPYWTDFSTRTSPGPDTILWVNSENVLINTGFGIDPPSYNIATFDGLDEFGIPYLQDLSATGPGDELISKPLDLSEVAESQNDSVFFSFFYQKEGKGELPDEEDSLRLQFKNSDSVWVTQWSASGNEILESDTFILALIKVEPAYFHDNFQFRFQWSGRLSGPYDTWNVDYILLNDRRHANDRSFDDRTITGKPSSIFNEFHAIPINQFFADTARYIGNASVGIATLSNRQDQAAEVTALLRFGNHTDTIDAPPGQPSDVVFSSLEKRTFTASPIKASFLNSEADSLNLELLVYYNASGDQPNEEAINFRTNDTISANFLLDDYYAYDDGTAEFGAGLNQARGRLAVQFILSEPDIVTAIDVHFPNIGTSLQGQSVEFFISEFLDDRQDTALYRQDYIIQRTNSINEFQTIQLNRSVPVSDTLYIGFRQSANDFVPVGFDKNTNSNDKVFFNVLGAWEQDTALQGSLMIRPVFGDDIILSANDPRPDEDFITIYPNPVQEKTFFKGSFEQVKIYNINGRKINARVIHSDNKGQIDFSNFPKGVYILHFKHKNEIQTEKVILY